MTVTPHAPHVAPLNHLADLAVATYGGEPYYHADHGGGIQRPGRADRQQVGEYVEPGGDGALRQ
jgi:hypothetical protein